jgi:single-stranded-DNA-specific exonuclease
MPEWVLNQADDQEAVANLATELDVPDIIADILFQRGIRTTQAAFAYYQPSLDQLHSPFLMTDMDAAVSRVESALRNNEHVTVLGDYDVDGITGASLLYLGLKKLGGHINYFIPERLKDGYGLSEKAIDRIAKETESNLIIAVDCGINAVEQVAYASRKNIDVIICDHHKEGTALPSAVAVLNPKRSDCNYPFKHLAGCGVAFKLVQAVYSRLEIPPKELDTLLELVAIGSAADVVPLTGENRILVNRGLYKLNYKPSIGIRSLIRQAKLRGQIQVKSIVLNIAPRINAVGRIGNPTNAVQLLTAENHAYADKMAQVLEQENIRRRSIDEQTFIEASNLIDEYLDISDDKAFVLYKENWHPGVIGIIAARLLEKYYKPVIILAVENGVAKGSARSVQGINILAAIQSCSDILLSHGGHEYAAGLTIAEENIKLFIDRFKTHIDKQDICDSIQRKIQIDADLKFKDINPRFVRLIKLAAPFGPDNRNPVFKSENISVLGEIEILHKRHIRMRVLQDGKVFDSIGFNMADRFEELEKKRNSFKLAYIVEENIWAGKKKIQLRIKDIA